MKKRSRLLCGIIAMVFAVVSCQSIEDLQDKVENLENRVAKLEKVADAINGNIAALQAVASGQAITSIEETDGVYTLNLSNGQTIVLHQGAVGMGKAPLLSIDDDGYWMVDYQDGNGPQSVTDEIGEKIVAVGQHGVTPQFSVSEDGYWTVSYDGGRNFSPVLDASGSKVKAVAESSDTDSYFASVEYTDEALVLTLKNGEQYKAPVVGGFLFKISGAEETVVFPLGAKKTFAVERKGVATTVISAPQGWDAYLSDMILTIQAPMEEPQTKASLADTRTDVAVIALSDAGHLAIAKVRVQLDGTTTVYDPAASIRLSEATTTTLTFDVSLENTVSWYYMFQSKSEIAPTAAELLESGTLGSERQLTFSGLQAVSEYVLYVLPCGEGSNGAVASYKAKTLDFTNLYEAYQAGYDITVGSLVFNKSTNGEAVLVSQQDFEINTENYQSVYFIKDGASVRFKWGEYKNAVTIIGDTAGSRPQVYVWGNYYFNGGDNDIAFKNVSFKMDPAIQRFQFGAHKFGKMVYDDCFIDLRGPLAFQHSASAGMDGLEVIDCDIVPNWNDAAGVARGLIETHNNSVYTTTLGDIVFRNNVVWSDEQDVLREFYIIHGAYGGDMNIGNAVVENNTFYNVSGGVLLNRGRTKALLYFHNADSFTVNGNIYYTSVTVAKGDPSEHQFCVAASKYLNNVQLNEKGVCDVKSYSTFPQFAGLYGNDGAGDFWWWGTNNLVTLSGNTIAEVVNPFKSEDIVNGIFIPKQEYASAGATR